MARRLGISIPRWINVCKGTPLGTKLALQIVARIDGVTLDWLYLGRRGGLTRSLDDRLETEPLPRPSPEPEGDSPEL